MRLVALALLAPAWLFAQDKPTPVPALTDAQKSALQKAVEANIKLYAEFAARKCSIPLLHAVPKGGVTASGKSVAAGDEKMLIRVPSEPIDRMPMMRGPAPPCDDSMR